MVDSPRRFGPNEVMVLAGQRFVGVPGTFGYQRVGSLTRKTSVVSRTVDHFFATVTTRNGRVARERAYVHDTSLEQFLRSL